MASGKTPIYPLLWILVLTLLFIGLQSQTQKPLTRAEDGPGFGILTQAKQYRTEKKGLQGFVKALEASRVFQQDGHWDFWGACYEEAYYCARACDSTALYNTFMTELTSASQLLNGNKDMPAKTQAIIWGRIGSIYHVLGTYDQAAVYYEKALPFAEQAADTALILKLYGSTANIIWQQGDDYRALHYLEKSLSLAIAQKDTPRIASTMTHLGDVWRTLDPQKSVPYYLESLTLVPENTETLMLLSKAYLEGDKNIEKALETAQKSWHLAEKDVEKTDALHQLGRVFYELKKYNQALRYYQQALDFGITGYGVVHPEYAKIHVFMGNTYRAKQDFQQALTAYNQTLDDLLPLFTPQRTDQNPTESDLTTTSLWIMEALLGKAAVYQKIFQQSKQQKSLVSALECAELALHYQNKIKLRYGDDESKFAINRYFSAAYETAIQSAFRLYKLSGSTAYAQRAFRISEQNKAVVLADALYKKEMKQVANVPIALLEQERRSQAQIAYFEKELQEAELPGQMQVIKDSLFQARRHLESQEQAIQQQYPAYGAALFNYRTDTPADSVRQTLPDDVALLEYFLGDSAIFTFLLTKDTFWVQEQPLPTGFDQAASAFLRTVNDWQFTSDSSTLASRLFLDNSRLLYLWLLEKPLAVTNARRLFIVPDGKLSMLPFELFLTQPYAGQWIDRDIPYLIKDRAVSYRFSCRQQVQKIATPSEGWGGFGLEYEEGTLSAVEHQGSSTAQGLRDFGPLPFAGDEIKAVKGVIGGSFWLNKEATRENFLKNAERHGILHLAMHGMVDERNPLRSRLLFSNSVAGSDPFVYASDLYNLQLQAGLSVLSACQSGTGTWEKGEGVMSLARAFAFAGCPSMVMSLWNVSDQSTSELMVNFYQQLKKGATKDDALRAAKIQYLKTVSPTYAKPIYWAAFVPIGEMNSLPASYFSDTKEWGSLAAWSLLLVLCAAIAMIYWKRRHHFLPS